MEHKKRYPAVNRNPTESRTAGIHSNQLVAQKGELESLIRWNGHFDATFSNIDLTGISLQESLDFLKILVLLYFKKIFLLF